MKEKEKKVAALSYNQGVDPSPKITALGKSKLADEIIAKAKENNVPVVEDPTLVELLANLNIDETIPTELYEAVAEVFAFVYQLDQNINKE